jgi:hypothetical protein
VTRQRYMKQETFNHVVGAYTLAKLLGDPKGIEVFRTAFDNTIRHYPSEDRKVLLRLVNQASFSVEVIADELVESLAKKQITQQPFRVVEWLDQYLWERALRRHSFMTKMRTIFLGYDKANYDAEQNTNRVGTCGKDYMEAGQAIFAAVGQKASGLVAEKKQ